ncbi:hypothetical protein COT78_02865 [Candidatus Berkelbacteria bacterium CG10_big_fil_rev_8_21_14_0_10_43_13]|uniref:CRISPR-associated endoribonuclease Cas2 n=1 Tax=Candidatus Berkelbacteria bacterium CG10_big_fil_rev_8_21_14_0_10_43_13 TaxID=1974514 RepID=A0A2H0W691_9BACT|nr:MAG: hypothetical protein COT78_02865 [Candidatus Berkelbacteria bacterium CG10_big_fil_rev_8_21_14_0_10_43_13]
MIQKETKEIIKLTSKEILLLFADGVASLGFAFTKSKKDKNALGKYLDERSIDRSDFSRKIYRLKQRGYIRKIVENKSDYIELTDLGKNRVEINYLNELKPRISDHWDKKWRIIIFDIPEKYRTIRDVIRSKLYELGFIQVQKSVFVYPFDCHHDIQLICKHYGGSTYIKYMIAEIIEGEEEFIEIFINNNILTKDILSF